MTQLSDFVGHQLIGQAYPINGNPHPSRAVLANITGSSSHALTVRVDDDDLIATVEVSPLWDEDLDFGSTPFLGEGIGEEFDEEWEFQFDFWK